MKPLPGDLILYQVTPRSSWASKIIAIGQLLLGKDRGAVQYSHVALWDTDGHQFEAVWPRIARTKIDMKRPFQVWRVKNVTAHDRDKLIYWAIDHCGEHYGMLYILTFGLIMPKGEEVCSTFAGHAYRSIGIHLDGARPDKLADSRLLYKIAENRP